MPFFCTCLRLIRTCYEAQEAILGLAEGESEMLSLDKPHLSLRINGRTQHFKFVFKTFLADYDALTKRYASKGASAL